MACISRLKMNIYGKILLKLSQVVLDDVSSTSSTLIHYYDYNHHQNHNMPHVASPNFGQTARELR
jgi:hypothetical protein